jgi:DMSO/TMAO reductase YedYZ molybdopterin-dependent catalytic subunit
LLNPGADVIDGVAIKQSRRAFLRVSLLASGALLAGFEQISAFARYQNARPDPFEGRQQLDILPFSGESRAPLVTVIGTGLDARPFLDLSSLTPEQLVTPTEKFYVRTTASELLETGKLWAIKVSGLVQDPVNLTLDDLRKTAQLRGFTSHGMLRGNTPATQLALLSVADWSGVPISDLLATRVKPKTNRVMVSGLDQHSMRSVTSIPGADCISRSNNGIRGKLSWPRK